MTLPMLMYPKEHGLTDRPNPIVFSPIAVVTSITSSAAASMTEFRKVKLTADDLRVELEVKSQLDKNVSHSPVIETGGEKKMSINNSAASSMTKFREAKSAYDDLRVEFEVKNQLDKDRPQESR